MVGRGRLTTGPRLGNIVFPKSLQIQHPAKGLRSRCISVTIILSQSYLIYRSHKSDWQYFCVSSELQRVQKVISIGGKDGRAKKSEVWRVVVGVAVVWKRQKRHKKGVGRDE